MLTATKLRRETQLLAMAGVDSRGRQLPLAIAGRHLMFKPQNLHFIVEVCVRNAAGRMSPDQQCSFQVRRGEAKTSR